MIPIALIRRNYYTFIGREEDEEEEEEKVESKDKNQDLKGFSFDRNFFDSF